MVISSGRTTTDHDEIRSWIDSRGGTPCVVTGTDQGGHTGTLRIDFPVGPHGNETRLQPISLDQFFHTFEEEDLAFVYQDQSAGGNEVRYYRFIPRAQANLPG